MKITLLADDRIRVDGGAGPMSVEAESAETTYSPSPHAGQRPGHLHPLRPPRLGHEREAAGRTTSPSRSAGPSPRRRTAWGRWRWRWSGRGCREARRAAAQRVADLCTVKVTLAHPPHGDHRGMAKARRGEKPRDHSRGPLRLRRKRGGSPRGADGRGRWCTTASARSAVASSRSCASGIRGRRSRSSPSRTPRCSPASPGFPRRCLCRGDASRSAPAARPGRAGHAIEQLLKPPPRGDCWAGSSRVPLLRRGVQPLLPLVRAQPLQVRLRRALRPAPRHDLDFGDQDEAA